MRNPFAWIQEISAINCQWQKNELLNLSDTISTIVFLNSFLNGLIFFNYFCKVFCQQPHSSIWRHHYYRFWSICKAFSSSAGKLAPNWYQQGFSGLTVVSCLTLQINTPKGLFSDRLRDLHWTRNKKCLTAPFLIFAFFFLMSEIKCSHSVGSLSWRWFFEKCLWYPLILIPRGGEKRRRTGRVRDQRLKNTSDTWNGSVEADAHNHFTSYS